MGPASLTRSGQTSCLPASGCPQRGSQRARAHRRTEDAVLAGAAAVELGRHHGVGDLEVEAQPADREPAGQQHQQDGTRDRPHDSLEHGPPLSSASYAGETRAPS